MRLVHSDWSVSPGKRWTAEAVREPEGWRVPSLRPTGSIHAFSDRLAEAAREDMVVAGFDFPIGVPAGYGVRTGLPGFRALLSAIGTDAFAQFADIAREPSDISITRPFYPASSQGGIKQQHLFAAHGVERLDDLRRLCELAHADRRAACPIFWTLGGNQVGRAALSGWLEVIRPSLEKGARLWPFDGSLDALTTAPGLVLAETYPAEAYGQVDVRFGGDGGKTSQAARLGQIAAIERWAEVRQVRWAAEVAELIQSGFGTDKAGEDRFDALLGLLGMIEAVETGRGEAPERPEVATWEGWILGQRWPATSTTAVEGAATKVKLEAEATTRTQAEPAMSLRTPDDLLSLGFVELGAWAVEGEALAWTILPDRGLDTLVDVPNALYAFVEGEAVRYIGKTSRSIRQRFRSYARPGRTQATNLKCNANIRAVLKEGGEVRVLAFTPISQLRYGEFGVNLAAGLEDSLIGVIQPAWNGNACGGLVTETAERERLEIGRTAAEALPSRAAEAQGAPLARFTISLGPTCYERGIVNPGVEPSHQIGADGETLLVYFADRAAPVPTRINRTANRTGAVRLAGGNPAFAAWFQRHYRPGDTVPCEVLSAHSIRFGLPAQGDTSSLAEGR